MRNRNQQAAKRNGFVIYVKVPAKELWNRIQSDPNSDHTRPNLAGGGLEEVQIVLRNREPDYLSCSNLIVDGMKPSEEIVQQITQFYRSNLRT
jgi:shikimate kinase